MQTYLTRSIKEFFLINILLLMPLIVFGLLFFVMKKGCNRNLRKSIGYIGTVIFGIVGVPIHEISHLIMCLIFRHKITQVSLFRLVKGRYDNILGFVKHKYNANSLYQTTGCFFIGIAPMIVGSSIIVWIINFLFPPLLANLDSFIGIDSLRISTLSTAFFHNASLIFSIMFSSENFSNLSYWIAIYVIISIALHMTISKADFDNALSGFALLEIIIFAFSLIGSIWESNSFPIFHYVEQISSILFSVLFIAFLMFGIVYLVSYLIYRIFQ
ncbi:MAG: hypothetical protein H2184_03275 [Candidatus Galacturonibacter soehngenii]|nr:hypothetical protein [Candidatus Galacturonibacter soehngenii]